MRNIKKTDPLFQSFMSVYYKWFQEQVGIKPKIDAADGKALKAIVKYFREITNNELNNESENENKNTDLETLLAWEFVFANYNKWDKFYQKQLNLRHINSNLMNILNSIKNGTQSIATAGKSITDQRKEIGDINE